MMWRWNVWFLSRRDSVGKEKGSILIGVLWALFFLSALAIAIHAYVEPQLRLVERLRDKTKMYYYAQAAFERAAREVMNDETQEYDTLGETWSDNEEEFKGAVIGEGTFSIERIEQDLTGEVVKYGLSDEERKVNINYAPYEVLKVFFEKGASLTGQEAGDLVDAFLDWRDEDDDLRENGAENGYYQTLEMPYSCKNTLFERVEEILLIKGMTQEIFDKLKNSMTVYGTGAVNINTAEALTLQSLGLGLSVISKVEEFRLGMDSILATEDDGVFSAEDLIVTTLGSFVGLSSEETDELNSAVDAGWLTVRSDYFRGQAVGRLDNKQGATRVEFIFDRSKNIKYWKE